MPPFNRRVFNALSEQCQIITFRCTTGEKATITSRAKRAGMSTSAYLRSMALTGKIVIKDAKTDMALLYQLKKIGTNLNQIARKFNGTGKVQPSELIKTCRKINRLIHQIKEQL